MKKKKPSERIGEITMEVLDEMEKRGWILDGRTQNEAKILAIVRYLNENEKKN